MGKPPATKDGHKCDKTRVRITSMMNSISQKHRAMFIVCHLFRSTIKPLFRNDTDGSEPSSIWVQRVCMRMCVCVTVLGYNRWDALRSGCDCREGVMHRTGR